MNCWWLLQFCCEVEWTTHNYSQFIIYMYAIFVMGEMYVLSFVCIHRSHCCFSFIFFSSSLILLPLHVPLLILQFEKIVYVRYTTWKSLTCKQLWNLSWSEIIRFCCVLNGRMEREKKRDRERERRGGGESDWKKYIYQPLKDINKDNHSYLYNNFAYKLRTVRYTYIRMKPNT